jgi:glycosyltransferase involved in cell wall biosynthesis
MAGMPRVGLDLAPLDDSYPPGMRRLARELAAELERRSDVELVRLAPPPGAGARRWRHLELPRLARARALDGIHSLTSAFAWRGRGWRVATLHELPWRHGVAENAGLAHRWWAGFAPLAAAAVVTATEATAVDARANAFAGRRRIRVIPWGVGPPFQEEPPPGLVDELVLARLRLSEDPILLAPGAVRAKKNLAAALRGAAAFLERERRRFQLVVTGPDGPDLRRDLALAQELGLARYVKTVGVVEDGDLPSLYRLASCTLALSLSEGFGFPVLESLACGTPVVVTAHSAQAEVAGAAGLAVEPGDPPAVARAIAIALARREELRWTLARRAREFPWSRSADLLVALWRELST